MSVLDQIDNGLEYTRFGVRAKADDGALGGGSSDPVTPAAVRFTFTLEEVLLILILVVLLVKLD